MQPYPSLTSPDFAGPLGDIHLSAGNQGSAEILGNVCMIIHINGRG